MASTQPRRASPRPIVVDGPARRGIAWAQTRRQVGHSTGGYASLNLAGHVGEDPDVTRANWAALAASSPWSRAAVATCDQVHGATVLEVERGGHHEVAADALISRTPGVAVGVYTADCVPVLMASPGLGAVAAVHCGWRGAAAGLATQALRALLRSPSGKTSPAAEVHVWIAAAIAGCSYEVGPEVAERFSGGVLRKREAGGWELDLSAAIRAELIDAGVDPRRIELSGADTFTDPTLYSYRRDGALTGRMLSAVGLAMAASSSEGTQ